MATSGTAGTFTCAALQRIQVEVDKLWADNQQKEEYTPQVEVLNAIRSNQTARLVPLENPEKDQDLRVYWAADCSTSITTPSDDCTIGGPKPEAQCKTYGLDLHKTAGFSVDEKVFRTSELNREQVVAKAMAKRMKELDEYLAQTTVAKLNAFAGSNQYLGGIGDPDSDGTYIDSPNWTPDIYGYFAQVKIMNKFPSAFMIHGQNLYQMYWQAQMNNMNVTHKDQLLKMQSLPSYWDMFNVDSVNGNTKASYMVSKGAVAFANKAYYPLNSPVQFYDQQRWSIESKALPGVFYDVHYNNVCSSNEITHNFSLFVKAGIFQNPLGCNEDVTGVIKFICGTNAGS